jgi:hypothetical protein
MSFRTPTHCRIKLFRNSQKERGPEHTHLIEEAGEFVRPLELAFAMNVVNDTNCDDKQSTGVVPSIRRLLLEVLHEFWVQPNA